MVALLPIPARAQSGSAAAAIQALNQRFPGVHVYEYGGRVRAVCGVPMTTGTTPRDAGQNWVTQYASVFGEPSPDLVEYSHILTTSGKTVVSYRQEVDGLPVEGSMLTIVTMPLTDLGSTSFVRLPTVVSASGRIALRPTAGLAPSSISGAQARMIAAAHPAGSNLVQWTEPRLVAVYPDEPGVTAYAQAVWKVVGSNMAVPAVTLFHVDPYSGEVIRHHDAMAYFDIQGTTTGKWTGAQGGPKRLEPDTWGNAAIPGTQCCPNPASESYLPGLRVQALDPVTLLPVATTYTSLSLGTYSLPVANSVQVFVEAALIGPYWEVLDARPNQYSMPSIPAPTERTAQPVTAPAVVNIPFNSSPQEYRTAHVNAYWHIHDTRRYFRDRIPTDNIVPGLDQLLQAHVNKITPSGQLAGAAGIVPTEYPIPGHIWFGASHGPSSSPGQTRNAAYSMIVSHEYGHYVLHRIRALYPGTANPKDWAFHEGFANMTAHLAHDDPIYGHNWWGCPCGATCQPPSCVAAPHADDPRARNPQYPDCQAASVYIHAQLLSAIWLDLLANMRTTLGAAQGLEATRQLHVDWTLLTDGGLNGVCTSELWGRVAHSQTVTEVLLADDDDGNLSNGTPHQNAICAAFVAHGVTGLCGSRPASNAWYADCTADGRVGVEDLSCFQRLFLAGSRSADCDRDQVLTIRDFLCYQHAYSSFSEDHR